MEIATVIIGVSGAVLGSGLGAFAMARRAGVRLAQERVTATAATAAAIATASSAATTAAIAKAAHEISTAVEAKTALIAAEYEARRRELETQAHRHAHDQEQLVERSKRVEALEKNLLSRENALATRSDTLDRRALASESREAALNTRDVALNARESGLIQREAGFKSREDAIAQVETTITAKLAAIAGLTIDQAKAELLNRIDSELAAEQSARIMANEKRVADKAKEQGIEIISRAIQRYAAEHTAATTTARIVLPDADYKGRIIGKEGRNIKAFEQAAGVDVILEEDQPSVLISCFDGIRRETARRALSILIEDGRIHPGRIEEVLAQVSQELERETTRRGEEAALACEVSGLHPQLIRLLGKLHYRTSYGQNVLLHTQEVAFLCGAMAADLGLDPRLGRRCGLMHDIGKALDHEQEGSHPVLGFEALKRWGENEIVANAALAHHEGHEVISAYTTLAAAADAISAARPGARHHSMENHLKRMAQVEEIALGYPGVAKAYAIQGGRELRVIVDAAKMNDELLAKTARDIARTIEDQVRFPGEIKVTLIRELRGIAVAR